MQAVNLLLNASLVILHMFYTINFAYKNAPKLMQSFSTNSVQNVVIIFANNAPKQMSVQCVKAIIVFWKEHA